MGERRTRSERFLYYSGILCATGMNVDIDDLVHISTLLDAEEQGLLAPVVHGKWEYHWFDSICSVCGYRNKADSVTRIRDDHNFCPNCGADMRGGENG